MLLIKIISDNVLRKYGYQYDALNRLSNSYYQKPDYSEPRTNGYNENLSYDKNGNITSLQRYGTLDVDGQTPPILIDNLQYVYDHTTQKVNQLVKVTDDTNNPNGFKDDGDGTNDADDDYAYDSNGNMISDQNKGITSITYNHLNLPIQINFGANGTITYLYNATGQKVRKRVQDATTGTTIETTTDYLDGYQYKDEELQFFPHSEGYVNYFKEHFYYVYNYTDHLGNIRLTYSKDPSTGVLKIIEENHYYPFGLKHGSYNTGKEAYTKEGELLKIKPVLPLFATSYAYKYTGKEWQSELGLNTYDFGARNYMPDLARWANIDPLAEKFTNWSPFTFCIDSPNRFVDPDGKEIFNVQGGVKYTEEDAQIAFRTLKNQASSKEGIKGIHFVYQDVTPEIYKHTLNSFRKGRPGILHYDSDKARIDQRRKNNFLNFGLPPKTGYHRDEYPYASTFEGANADVAYVPATENLSQGGKLGALYKRLKSGDAFLVLPVPTMKEPNPIPDPVNNPVFNPTPNRKPIEVPEGVGSAIGEGIMAGAVYEVAKWVVAGLLAPETGGGSLVGAAAMP